MGGLIIGVCYREDKNIYAAQEGKGYVLYKFGRQIIGTSYRENKNTSPAFYTAVICLIQCREERQVVL